MGQGGVAGSCNLHFYVLFLFCDGRLPYTRWAKDLYLDDIL